MAKKAIYGKYECVESSYIEWYLDFERSYIQHPATFQGAVKLWEYISIDPVSGVLYGGGSFCMKETFVGKQNKFDPVWELKVGVRKISHTNPNPFSGGGSTTDQEIYVRRQRTVTTYSKGAYITDTIADYNSLPANGRHSDGYWYVYIKMASDLKGNDTGIWRDIPTGWANDSGVWKPQSELKANVNGIFK